MLVFFVVTAVSEWRDAFLFFSGECPYLGILVVPPEDRHSLALVLLELLAPAPLKGPARRWVWGISL